MSDPSAAPGRSLIDVVASAGAAVDRAQVACDLLAHRIVAVVATTDPSRAPDAHAALRDGAGACHQLSEDAAVLTRQYHTARRRHLDALDAFAAPLPDPVAAALDDLDREGTSIEASAVAVGRAIDAAERRLRARTAPAGMRPPAAGADPPRRSPPGSDDVLLN